MALPQYNSIGRPGNFERNWIFINWLNQWLDKTVGIIMKFLISFNKCCRIILLRIKIF
jgi:hypothetical protein